MRFLLQADDVTVMEKRAVRQAAMLSDTNIEIALLPMENLQTTDSRAMAMPADICPVGTVEFVTAWARLRGLELPPHMSYPDCLRTKEFLRREIREGVFADVRPDEFVKPRYAIKSFTGALLQDVEITDNIAMASPVWISQPVRFVSEWRFYVCDGELVGNGRYDDGPDEAPVPDIELVKQAIAEMNKGMNVPQGYVLDFGVLDDGRTALIEANDGWAVGWYGKTCKPADYARLLWRRWQGILGANSEKQR